MGADLIVVALSIDKDKEPDWQAGHDYIDKIKDSDIKKTVIFHLADDAREYLHAQLYELENAWDGDYRDSVTLFMRGARIFITGGTSWGDSPSQTFDAINDLEHNFPEVLDACGFDKGG